MNEALRKAAQTMGRAELCAWLRAASTGENGPAAQAADEIEHLAGISSRHFEQAMKNGAAANELLEKLVQQEQAGWQAALTDRQISLMRYALLRFACDAHSRASAAAQKTSNMPAGAVDSFLADAKDAEELRSLLTRAPMQGDKP